MAGVIRKIVLVTSYKMPNNTYLARLAAKSIPSLTDVGVLPLAVPGQVGLLPAGRSGLEKVANDYLHYS